MTQTHCYECGTKLELWDKIPENEEERHGWSSKYFCPRCEVAFG